MRGLRIPGWLAAGVLDRYHAGASHLFLLHGNVRDVHPFGDGYVPLAEGLRGLAARRPILVSYDVSSGFTFPDADDDLVRASHALWQSEIAYAREVLERTDLDAVVDVHGEPSEVRDIVVHMIEEYARHCGHADLLREAIDGVTGD